MDDSNLARKWVKKNKQNIICEPSGTPYESLKNEKVYKMIEYLLSKKCNNDK